MKRFHMNIYRQCCFLFLLLIFFACNSQADNKVQSTVLKEVNQDAEPIIIEVAGPLGESLDPKELTDLCSENGISPDNLYQWKNHLVVFANLPNPEKLKKRITLKYPDCAVRVYNNMFYEFNRRKHCNDGHYAKTWDHILLTANLVADERLQNEYLNYHANQFESWPEVAKGFCNADFQQLLLFKNGRQLMLVISIPKGASLDELNPRTSVNNPRVDQWNRLMKKYQEGIPGTQPDEVWVFLQKIGK